MSSSLDAWQWALVGVAVAVALVAAALQLVGLWARAAYGRLLANPRTHCDIDSFVGPANPVAATKVVLMTKTLSVGNRTASTEPIPLAVFPSPHVPGLLVTRKQGTGSAESAVPLEQLLRDEAQQKRPTPIVVATIRMGFGHHRLAYSAASWALQKNSRSVIFHDLLSIDSPEADLIKSTDEMYSRFSRWASEVGGLVEKLWGSAMLQGDANALRMAALTAAHLQPLLLAFPKDVPLVTTHQLVALTASACGFTNVVNLVVDNHPQWFLTVPNTLNLVQGPVNYQCFLQMGVPPDQLQWAGHWCPHDLVSNLETDGKARVQRRANRRPLRLLVPVGGAGAQRSFILGMVEALAPLVRSNRVQLLLNAGDHVHMKTAFLQVLDKCNLEFDSVSDAEGVRQFCDKYRLDKSNATLAKGVTLFAFDEYFPAVATTDLLCRTCDVLCCKPSELAFYCVPKLHIRRVGDHEADSAKRSSELGDGTVEARELKDVLRFVHLMETTDLLNVMNQSLLSNRKIGIYHGCQKAIDLAVERAASAASSAST